MTATRNRCVFRFDQNHQCWNQAIDGGLCFEHLQEESTASTAYVVDVYRQIGEHFRQDIKEFWQRSNFFLLVQSALFTVYASSVGNVGKLHLDKSQLIVVSVFGIVLAIYWYIIAITTAIWCRAWGNEFVRMEWFVDRNGASGHAKFIAQQELGTSFLYWFLRIFRWKDPLDVNWIMARLPLLFILAWLASLIALAHPSW